MNERELRKFIGNKIKEYRKEKRLTQEELGVKLGVKNNTISAYERGTISVDQDAIFKLSGVLGIKPNDLFPPMENADGNKYLNRLNEFTNQNFDVKDMHFLQQLIEKALSMDEIEREKFLESIRFTVDYYNKMNK